MKTLFPSTRPTSIHHFGEIFGFEFPPPVVQRGWLHGRESTQPWDVERLAREIGDEAWLSYYQRDPHSTNAATPVFRPVVLAGYWPSGGFLEVQMNKSNSLEEYPRGVLTIYAETPLRATQLMTELLAGYRHDNDRRPMRPRVGVLNLSSRTAKNPPAQSRKMLRFRSTLVQQT